MKPSLDVLRTARHARDIHREELRKLDRISDPLDVGIPVRVIKGSKIPVGTTGRVKRYGTVVV